MGFFSNAYIIQGDVPSTRANLRSPPHRPRMGVAEFQPRSRSCSRARLSFSTRSAPSAGQTSAAPPVTRRAPAGHYPTTPAAQW